MTKFHKSAEQQQIPFRTLQQVKDCLARDKKKNNGTDVAMAKLMLKHGRLTNEAREYVQQYVK